MRWRTTSSQDRNVDLKIEVPFIPNTTSAPSN
jgi:hypothetical protein